MNKKTALDTEKKQCLILFHSTDFTSSTWKVKKMPEAAALTIHILALEEMENTRWAPSRTRKPQKQSYFFTKDSLPQTEIFKIL